MKYMNKVFIKINVILFHQYGFVFLQIMLKQVQLLLANKKIKSNETWKNEILLRTRAKSMNPPA